MQNRQTILTINAREIPMNAALTLCYARSIHVNVNIYMYWSVKSPLNWFNSNEKIIYSRLLSTSKNYSITM